VGYPVASFDFLSTILPQDGPQDNIAAEFSVAADAASQNRSKRNFGLLF